MELSSTAGPALLPLCAATTADQFSYHHYGVYGAVLARQMPCSPSSSAAAAASAALKASKSKKRNSGGRRGRAGVQGLACFMPLGCTCSICCRLLAPSLGEVKPTIAPVPPALQSELSRPKNPKDRPEKAPVAVNDPTSRSLKQRHEDYQVRKLDEDGGGLRRMLVRDVTGVEWGLFTLMGGAEKPQRFTDQYHCLFFVLRGRACFTIGDEYTVPLTKFTVAEGSTAQVPRGNYYSIKNADAAVLATFMFYRTRAPTTRRSRCGGGTARR